MFEIENIFKIIPEEGYVVFKMTYYGMSRWVLSMTMGGTAGEKVN